MPRKKMSQEEEKVSKKLAQDKFFSSEKGKRARRNSHLMYQYGITVDEYELMSEQQNHVCAICKEAEMSKNSNGVVRLLAVDHCHQSGKIRGLLCNNCNTLLGRAKDSPAILQSAIDYLKE